MNEDRKFIILDKGIVFVPRFVKQESDMEYGSVVTHENYNEKLNLNTTQGDYNTEILRLLLSIDDPKKVPHVPYLDRLLEQQVNRLDTRIDEHIEDFEEFKAETEGKYQDIYDQLEDHDTRINNNYDELTLKIQNIIEGVTKVKHAEWADHITGITEAGPHYYYGTDYDNQEGFFRLPDAIYCEDAESGMEEIQGIIFTPRPNSIDQTMLTQALRDKINEEGIKEYDQLIGRPSINNVVLSGNKTLSDLGIQPAGPYLTEVPIEYITSSQLENILNPSNVNDKYVTYNDVTSEFLKLTVFNSFKNTTISTMQSDITDRARVFVNSTGNATLRDGDLLVTV